MDRARVPALDEDDHLGQVVVDRVEPDRGVAQLPGGPGEPGSAERAQQEPLGKAPRQPPGHDLVGQPQRRRGHEDACDREGREGGDRQRGCAAAEPDQPEQKRLRDGGGGGERRGREQPCEAARGEARAQPQRRERQGHDARAEQGVIEGGHREP